MVPWTQTGVEAMEKLGTRFLVECEELEGAPSMEDIFHRLAHLPYSCFLDSSLVMPRLGLYSFIGYRPFLVFLTRGYGWTRIYRDGSRESGRGNPFEVLRETLSGYALEGGRPPEGVPPLLGGCMGYLSYELGRYIERLPGRARDDLGIPEMCLAFYDQVISHDHRSGRTFVVGLHPRRPGAVIREVMEDLEGDIPTYSFRGGGGKVEFRSNFTRERYLEAVRRVKEYIYAGDIYQANLTQRFQAPIWEHPWLVYRRLRRFNAAPFAAYFNAVEAQILSSSPELFLRGDGRKVETRPIKGTRRRSEDPVEDECLKRELLASDKDRAELSMIVDLERNDLGRVCSYGTVDVEEHAVIESYATVHHLVSTVTGELHPDKDVVDLLKATFPGGSITGAPKIRAMEIIDELEPNARSVYTGCVGYLGYDGSLELNIAIRTVIVKGDRAYFQVGGGIVADSVPEDEYQETLDKGKAIFQALSSAPS
jgi:para-aminobenzoate synthetase component 1